MSAFPDGQPGPDELKKKLGSTHPIWDEIKRYIHENYPYVNEEWFTSGMKYGWSFRISYGSLPRLSTE